VRRRTPQLILLVQTLLVQEPLTNHFCLVYSRLPLSGFTCTRGPFTELSVTCAVRSRPRDTRTVTQTEGQQQSEHEPRYPTEYQAETSSSSCLYNPLRHRTSKGGTGAPVGAMVEGVEQPALQIIVLVSRVHLFRSWLQICRRTHLRMDICQHSAGLCMSCVCPNECHCLDPLLSSLFPRSEISRVVRLTTMRHQLLSFCCLDTTLSMVYTCG
jgi:hypothetical protein